MNNLVPISSRQAIRGVHIPPTIGNQTPELRALWRSYRAEPIQILRTRDGRSLSRERFRRTEEFMSFLASNNHNDWNDFLYNAGIVVQLALSSHLLDVGFSDDWCARNIGLNIAQSFAYANATGFGHECVEAKRLMDVLSPYWKWNRRSLAESPQPSDGGFTPEEIRTLLCNIVTQVHHVTGDKRTRSIG